MKLSAKRIAIGLFAGSVFTLSGCGSVNTNLPVSNTPITTEKVCATSVPVNYDKKLVLGDYTLSTNAWGKGVLTNFINCVQGSTLGTISQSGVAAVFNWNWGLPTIGSGVKAYPEILYRPAGKSLQPIPFSKVGNLTMHHDISLSATGTYNVAYDLWADSVSSINRWPHDAEIMIKLSANWLDGPIVDTVNLGGVTYDVTVAPMVQNSGTWKLISFNSKAPYLKGDIPLKQFTDYLIAKSILPPSYHISTIEFGHEIVDGVGVSTIHSYSVTP